MTLYGVCVLQFSVFQRLLQVVQDLSKLCFLLLRVFLCDRLSLLAEQPLAVVHVIVEHEDVSEVLGHPVPLRNEAYNIVRVSDYLAVRIAAPVRFCLTFRNADDRVNY